MASLKQSSVDYLCDSIQNYFNIKEYKSILQFAVEDIDLSGDVSSSKDRIDLENYPYFKDVLQACVLEKGVRKEVVLMGMDQAGKTTLQLIVLLYNCTFNTLQSIVAYPSDDLAIETAQTKFLPLFKNVPQFKADLEKPFAIRSDRFKLSNALIWWAGAGAKIVSKSCKLVIGDEAALWSCPNVNNIAEMKKRTRSFDECVQFFLSTPQFKQDNFSRQFLQSSQGFYTLRCCNCGELTMRSCDLHNLQFETIYNEDLIQYVAVRGSERLICPKCHFEHDETYREQLVKNGAYVHKFKDKIKTFPGFQIGALASLLTVHCWSNLADVQLASGKSATLEDYISFDASYRGLYYQQRDYNKQDESALKQHFYKPGDLKQEDIEAVIIAADTQDTFSVYAVIALTRQNNYYVIDMGRLRYLWLEDEQRKVIDAENKRNGKAPEKTMLDLLESQFYGFKPLCLMVDERGHRSTEIKNFSRMKKNIIMYAGTNLKFEKWKPSDTVPKMFMCDAKKFQAELIFMLYYQKKKETNYLYLPENMSEQDLEQITSFQPDTEHRNGNLFENWTPKDKVHDMFDTVKMGLACFEISSKIFRKERFAHGEARLINPVNIKHQKPVKKQQKNLIPHKPLFRKG